MCVWFIHESYAHALHTTYKTCSNSIFYGSQISHIIMMAVAQRETHLDHFEDIQKRGPLHQNDLTTHQCLESLQSCIQKSLPLPAIAVLLKSCTLTLLWSRATALCTIVVVTQICDIGTNTNIHVKAFAITTLKWFQGGQVALEDDLANRRGGIKLSNREQCRAHLSSLVWQTPAPLCDMMPCQMAFCRC